MKKQTLKRIFSYAAPFKRYMVLAFVFAVIYVACTLISPVLVGSAIDNIVKAGNVDFAKISITLVYVALAIAGASLSQWVMNYFTQRLSISASESFRNSAFIKLNKIPLGYIDTTAHGDIISRMINDTEMVADGMQQGLLQLLPGIVTIAGTLIIMLILNPFIALVVVIVTPLSIFVAGFIAKKSKQYFTKQSAASGKLSAYINEMVASQNLVKAFGNEKKCQMEFDNITDELFATGLKSQFYSSISNPATRFVNAIVYTSVGVIGAINVIWGSLTIGQLSCFLTYANQYTKPFNEITGVLTQLQSALAGAQRLFEILDLQDEKQDAHTAKSIDDVHGKIDIENVYFSYMPQKPLIENFNLHVKKGQRIAIVGPTGCGKTTLINLLMRFYDVNSGSILVDDIDIYDIKRKNLRSLYGMVLQETWLCQASVKENIAYGKQNATDEEIIAAAKVANAHGFIKRLPDGYDTIITSGGGNISAGQKQLLCIARIMLTNPDMLILDEATSSIDTRTEMLIQKAFDKLMQGKTSFIVAHRLSTIQTADIILVMNSGHIIEQGTHDELLLKKGFYANLYYSQFTNG